jgi:ArsR family transcriptional regulator
MDTKQMARVFQALSNPNRLELYLQIMKAQETSYEKGCGCLITDIMNLFSIGAPTISHHLKELSDAGLITTERQGKFLTARINQSMVDEVCAMLSLRKADE